MDFLSLNKIGDEGAKAIADSLKSGMAVVTTLYLGYNSIVIAEALKINAVVTKLWPGLETELRITSNMEDARKPKR